MLGVYEISIKKISFETGINRPDIEKYLLQFEKDGKIMYKENRVVLLNYLKHQNFNTNMMKSAIECYNELPIKLKLLNINTLEKTKQGFETLCQGFGMVRKDEYELEVLEDEVEDESKVEGECKKSENKPHLFCDSIFFVFEEFEKQFEGTDYELADLRFYYENVKNWSAGGGNKKLDWIATARNFMLKDRQENKLILKNGKSNKQTDLHDKYQAQHERAAEAFRRGE